MSKKKPRRKEPVARDERIKAKFLSDYTRLCMRHGMMVVQIPGENYSPYVVLELPVSADVPTVLNHCVQEMLVSDLWVVDSEEVE